MIDRWLITGDCHGDFSRFKDYPKELQKDKYTAVIILGDAGLNWTLDENDDHMKDYLSKNYKFRIYCVRGNHEARPQDVEDMNLVYDDDVHGFVYMQDKWPNIRYFKDYGIYWIDGLRVCVIGGAYSVDKYYRLQNGYRWFKNEQLSKEEQEDCLWYLRESFSDEYDLVLTHTCPISWEPTDLFLNAIDQSKVDKTMENFLERVKDSIRFNVWCFGHYHADRAERPGVEQFFITTDNLNNIIYRWKRYADETGDRDWYLVKSPNFYMGVNSDASRN